MSSSDTRDVHGYVYTDMGAAKSGNYSHTRTWEWSEREECEKEGKLTNGTLFSVWNQYILAKHDIYSSAGDLLQTRMTWQEKEYVPLTLGAMDITSPQSSQTNPAPRVKTVSSYERPPSEQYDTASSGHTWGTIKFWLKSVRLSARAPTEAGRQAFHRNQVRFLTEAVS